MLNPQQKARSRLHRPVQTEARQVFSHQRSKLKQNGKAVYQFVNNRLRFIPLLILALLFYSGVYWLVLNIRPSQISDLLLPNSYLPFHALLLPANFFLFTFLTLSKRWGILIALIIQWLLFLKLQN